jgi:hypothetical protein
MNIQFFEPAQAEFSEAVNYYNVQTKGLGFEFSDEVQEPSAGSLNTLKLGHWSRREQGVAGQSAFHLESSIRSGAIPFSSLPSCIFTVSPNPGEHGFPSDSSSILKSIYSVS